MRNFNRRSIGAPKSPITFFLRKRKNADEDDDDDDDLAMAHDIGVALVATTTIDRLGRIVRRTDVVPSAHCQSRRRRRKVLDRDDDGDRDSIVRGRRRRSTTTTPAEAAGKGRCGIVE